MRIWNTFLSVTIAILLAAFPAVAAFQGTILPVSKGGTGAATLDGAGIVTKTGTQTIAGAKTLSDTATFNKTAEASTAETIATFKVSDHASSLDIINVNATNSAFNGALSWGTQSGAEPTFTTKSSGTRLVFYNQINGSNVDYALGFNTTNGHMWSSVASSTSSLAFDWFAGTTKVAAINGVGLIASSLAGGGFGVKEGTNATMGSATLVGGTATVSTTKVTANSRIFLTSNADGGTPGWVRVSGRTAATSFTITSSSGADTSSVAWIIFEPQ